MLMWKYLRANPQAALLLGIVLIAASLRAPFTVVPALLGPIGREFGLNSVGTGALTTLPLIVFALISSFGGQISGRLGLERALAIALAAIIAGIGLRSFGSVSNLFVGTAIIGVGVAIGNVLLPSLVKRDFPLHIASLTGAYVLAMNICAGLGSAAVVPMADVLGWRHALLCFAALPVIALVVWMRQTRSDNRAGGVTPEVARGSPVWRSPLAWQVTLFLGLNSAANYVMLGWLPAILIDAGFSPTRAGSMHGVLFLASALPALCLGMVLRRVRDQRGVALAMSVLWSLSMLGLMFAPQYALLWAIMFGIGNGAGFVLALSFIALRASTTRQAAALSGMAQCIGYSIAALGPVVTGALHDASGRWVLPLALCAVMGVIQSFLAVRAGRNIQIGTT